MLWKPYTFKNISKSLFYVAVMWKLQIKAPKIGLQQQQKKKSHTRALKITECTLFKRKKIRKQHTNVWIK